MPMIFDQVDLRAMRPQFAGYFPVWDRAAEQRDRRAAKHLRSQILEAANEYISDEIWHRPGWYVFSDLDAGIAGVHYVGIAKTVRRSIGNRICDRFRDDSCLDVGLDHLPVREQERIARARLLAVVTKDYVPKHMETSQRFRECSHISMVGAEPNPPGLHAGIIEDVERLLVAGARQAGAQLRNKHLLNLNRTRVLHRSAPLIAMQVLGILEDRAAGLSPDAIAVWRSALRRLAGPLGHV